MTDIDVVRHGNRWAVQIAGDTRSEHETAQEAVLEAKRLGGGAEPTVHEEDRSGLADVQDATDDAGTRPGGPSGVQPSELTRETQAGL